MAAAKKSTANRTKASRTKKKSTKVSAKSKSVHNEEGIGPYRDEIILLTMMVISILLILSNFDLCGNLFGPFFKNIEFGLFGILAYLLPFFLFLGTGFAISNRGSKVAKRKLMSAALLYIVIAGLIQLITVQFKAGTNVFRYYTNSAKSHTGGGLIGGILSHVLCTFFGEIGSYVILIGVMALLFMFLTEKLLFAGLSKRTAGRRGQTQGKKQMREGLIEDLPMAESAAAAQVPRRRARTVTIPKDSEDILGHEQKEEGAEPSVPGPRRKKKEKKKKEDFLNVKVPDANLEDTNHNISNVTGLSSDEISQLPVYEEELIHKFSHASDDILYDTDDETGDMSKQPKKSETMEGDEEELLDVAWNLNGQPPVQEQNEEMAWNLEEESKSAEHIAAGGTQSVPPLPAEPIKGPAEEKEPLIYNKNDRVQSDKIVSEKAQMEQEVKHNTEMAANKKLPHVFPPVELLNKPKNNKRGMSDQELKMTAIKLQSTLESFGVKVTITNVSCGPTVTRYELAPEQGVKVSKITGLADDIKLNLAAADIRIEAPIPGKAAVGIEVPNKENATVMLRELLESNEFKTHSSNIAFAVGKDIGGQTVVTDIGKMPHLLIAGATGSGKSVCINTLIMSILYKADPEDVKMIMVDPKVVELSVYNGIPHLLIPVVTDPKKASAALHWAVMEMTERYKKFADLGVRDLKGYNKKIKSSSGQDDFVYEKMPQIVIIVDELADLMMVAPGEVEESICRLAQLARAAGIHLIIATQRPSVNVITGLIKANIPSRIAFSVSSAVDSRTILDGAGAEKLLGKGDMLFFPSGIPKPVRVQGAFVSDKEVGNVVEFLHSKYQQPSYDQDMAERITSSEQGSEGTAAAFKERDDYFEEAGRFIIEKDKASIGMLQRVYKIGFNRAARIMDQLYEAGVVGEEEGTKPRKIIMTLEEFNQMVGR